MLNLDKNKIKKIVNLFKSQTKKKCYKAKIVNGEPSILEDKLGGLPYLPLGEDYPKDKNNKPLSLLLQVNLKNIKLPYFPKKGILEVFTNNDFPCEYSIKLFSEGLKYQTTFPEIDCEYPFISKPLKIKLKKDYTYMPFSNYRANGLLCQSLEKLYGIKTDLDFNVIDFIQDNCDCDFYEEFNSKLKIHNVTIGGYADFTQEDPRENNDDRTECLFKIDSGIKLVKEIQIGDNGIIFGLISKQNLKEQKLNNTFVNWDCC